MKMLNYVMCRTIWQSYSVAYDFKDIPCAVNAKLLDSYSLDVYGSQLWNYSKHDVDMFFTAGRKSIQRLWKIPNTIHCNL